MLHYRARQLDRVFHVRKSANGAGFPRGSIHDRGVELVLPVVGEYGAAAGVEERKVLPRRRNLPANYATPTYLGEQALAMVKTHGLEVEVLDRKACEKLGMGSFLSVAQGSDEPPKFIVMQYKGGAKKDAPVVLVGKGITFDTGRHLAKPGRRDGRDEVRHVRRRQRAGHLARRRGAQAQGQPRRA